MKEKALIIATMEFVDEDRSKSWFYFLSTLVLSVLAFSGTYWVSPIVGKILFSLLAGLLTSRLFVIYHDFHHGSILRNSSLANALMWIVGILTLSPSSIWDETHQHHHTNNSKFSKVVMGSFPTITSSTFKAYNNAQRFWYLLIRHPLMIVFAYIPIFLVSFCLWPFFESPKKYYDCGLAAIIHGMIFALLYILGGWQVVFFSMLLPCFILFAVGGYIFYAQHNFPEVKLKNDSDWDYLDAALHSSSFIKMNWLMRWFTANIGYHHVHHVNSRIPFYRLPEVMAAFKELQNPRSTSLNPKEIWACLHLKFWDEDLGRMITLKEFKKLNKPVNSFFRS